MERIRTIAITLLFAVAASALWTGYSFMSDSSGHSLKVSVEILRFSPFKNFLIPGLVLFSMHGLLNLTAGIALIRRWRYSALLLIVQGMLLTGWIIIQVSMLREFNFLHAVFGSLGILFCLAGIFLQEKTRVQTEP